MRYLCSLLVLMFLYIPAVAQGLECKQIDDTRGGIIGGPAQADAKIGADDLAAGYTITGGGCDFSNGKDAYGAIMWSMPVVGGYSCRAKAVSTTEFLIVKAYAIACRGKRPHVGDGLRRAPFSNVGLGGGTVGIARADRGAIPYSIRICNLSGGVPIDVDLTVSQRSRVEFGQCVEVDKPQRAFFRTPTSVDVDAHGQYEIFPPGTFPAKPRVGPRTPVGDDKRVQIAGPIQSAVADCQKPAPGESFDAKSYWGYCPLLELKANRNYRVCFDNGYSGQGQKLEYPGGLLPLVLDKSLMAKPNPGQLDPYLYMGIEPAGCRDLFGVNTASILIIENAWNGQAVSKVTYRYAEIPAPK